MPKRIFSILLFLFFLCNAITMNTIPKLYASEPPRETELYAKSAVLMDSASGRILYEKNGHKAMANASTTKILTCILAMENCEMNSVVTVSANAASQPKVHLGMRSGQTFYMEDLLYGLMLESFNDCAVAIAEHIAGTTKHFADMMNNKAKEIGCKDSYFITPNGLDAKDEIGFHHTTAADLALIMRYCISQSEKAADFLKLTATPEHSFSDTEQKNSYHCYNHNAFLQMMEGALSGKTGFTGTAGYCYVGSLVREGKTYIVALLACGWPNNKSYKWADTKKLMNYGLENFEKRSISDIPLDENSLQPIEAIKGQGAFIGEKTWIIPVIEEADGLKELLVKKGEDITVEYEIAKSLQAPISKGECIGKITYLLGNETLKECTVKAKNEIEKIDYAWCVKQVLQLLCL
ncbi:MAG: D-alanyl-D-alanine carboxypeptidase family protein [Roseburia sp.]